MLKYSVLYNYYHGKNKYFKSWCLRKGYVSIKEIYNFKLWLEYAKRNHKLLENMENSKNEFSY